MERTNWIYTYYQQIKNGSVVVGRFIVYLYEYLIDGLQKKAFRYDAVKADHAIDWIETHCFHTEGPLAPGPLKLELWQKALIACVFGLVDENGNRQFREVVLIVARKNGKSLLASAICNYMFRENGGYGARVYCLAPKLEQANIIYDSVWHMCQLDPEQEELKLAVENSKDVHNKRTRDDSGIVKRRVNEIYFPNTNSSVRKIAFNARKSDGFNPSLTICDETAAWEGDKGLKQYEVMKSGMGARPESLLVSCSTAGYVSEGIYDELYKRSTRFLLGDSKEKRLLPFLYVIDDIAKWNDINELRKSSPNLGVSVSVDYLLEEIAIAEGSLSRKAEFICKMCNVKQNSSQAWLLAQDVEKCFGDPLRLDDFRSCYCVGGIDLSRTTDLTSCCVVIEKNGRLNVFSRFFMPSERIEEATARDGVPYRILAERGLLTLSGDNFVDYHDCENWFNELVRDYEILPLQIGYDRYSAQYLVQDLKTFGFHMDDVYQGTNLTPVIRECEGLIRDGRLYCGDNDLLKMHLLDSAVKVDAETDKLRLIKLSAGVHIDGTAALLDALCVRQKWYSDIGEQLKNEDV